MIDQSNEPAKPNPSNSKPESKSSIVTRLLTRTKGATMGEIMEATSWQDHSVRAHLSGLRKKGNALAKEQRKSGEQAYRMTAPAKVA